jgi:DNA mismatch endonuclease (patch repair protein)
MADVVTPEIRSRMMSGIRGKNTKPEIFLRRALHGAGFRFRLHAALPGRPDIVLAKWRAVLFAHGCFWHGHQCRLFKWPQTRTAFWRKKISDNISRDESNIAALLASGWRVGVVWECAIRGPGRFNPDEITARCSRWLKSSRKRLEMSGR